MSWRERIALLTSVKMAEEVADTPMGGAVTPEEPVESDDNLASLADEDLWGDILQDTVDEDLEPSEESSTDDVTPAEEPAPTAAEVPAENTPAVEVKTEAPVVTEPIVEPVTEVPAVVPEQPTVPEQPAQVQTPEQQQAVQQQMLAARGKVVDQLADMYALSDDESETLQLEPEKILPRLAAQVHMNVIEALTEGIQSQLPAMIAQAATQSEAQDKTVDDFYTTWPALKGDGNKDTVLRVMQSYRNANPKASTEQVIREGGAMAMVALQLPINTAPAAAAPAPVPAQVPVQPAMPGSSTVPVNTADASNPYAQMFLDANEEDV